ncbi:glycosyltransferase [Microbacterium esteraromaticum]|uniref:Glycosyltransferase n=1 Tax=Microbacterium esteraromaticum TaxID=57043 RepID=A0A7D8ALX1_9MICO|nr:glycosyltransferase [Microbacterium esteraromaticum]QMU97428.1 glycosyltransferase [Microbacterium esteraromaticum]
MAKRLVLLTNYYPFFRGEEYVERELTHLVERFDQVLVVPTMRSASMSQTRVLPPGAVLVDTRYDSGMAAKARQLRAGFPHRAKPIGSTPWNLPVRIAYESYFEGRSREVAARVASALRDRDLSDQDSILIYSYWLYVTARVGMLLAEGPLATWRPRVVSRAHGYDINAAASPVNYLPARSRLLTGLDAVFPVAEYSARRLRAEYPEHAPKVGVRRLGVVPAGTSPVSDRTSRVIVTCSTIRPLKRLELVAEAVARLRSDGLDVRWVHLGWGAEKYASTLVESSRRLLGDAVQFRGHIDNGEIGEWYRAAGASAFVNVSTSEGVPVSVMEAMRAGVPVVVTDVGGTTELLPQGWPYVLDAGCAAADLAEAIRDVLELPDDEYRRLGTSMRREWAENWNGDVVFGDFADELIELMDADG